jgi:hypothetical protein
MVVVNSEVSLDTNMFPVVVVILAPVPPVVQTRR